jgi:hypothetical protein
MFDDDVDTDDLQASMRAILGDVLFCVAWADGRRAGAIGICGRVRIAAAG